MLMIRTLLLLSLLSAILIAAGFLLGGISGMTVALAAALAINFISF
jgi:hypothetical protein